MNNDSFLILFFFFNLRFADDRFEKAYNDPPVSIPRMYIPITSNEIGTVILIVRKETVTLSRFWNLNNSTTALIITIRAM
jgi:hypothetical protein